MSSARPRARSRLARVGAASLGVIIAQAAVLAIIGAAIGLADSRIRPVRLGFIGPAPIESDPPARPPTAAPPAVENKPPQADPTPPAPTPRPAQQPPEAPPPSTGGTTRTPAPVASGAPAAFRPTTEEELRGKPNHITLDRALEMHQFMGAIFLDARNAEEFAAGHIEGAHFAPLSRFRSGDVPGVLTDPTARELPIVVYCGGGDDCQASEDVALHLNGIGFFNVHVLHDGITGWQAVGNPVAVGGPQ